MSAPYDDIVEAIMAELAALPGGSAGTPCVEPLVRKVIEYALTHVEGVDLLSTGVELGKVPVAQGDGAVLWQDGGGGGGGDMLESEYATNGTPGVVDHAVTADDLQGSVPADFAPAVHEHSGNDITSPVAAASVAGSASTADTAATATVAEGINDGTYSATAQEIREACDKPAWLGGPYRMLLAVSRSVTFGEGGVAAIGQFALAAGDYTISRVWLEACIWMSGTLGASVRVRLYNLTDSEYVTDAVCTTNSAVCVRNASSDLVVGGDPGDLQSTVKMYEIRLELLSGAAPLDAAHLGSVYLVMEGT